MRKSKSTTAPETMALIVSNPTIDRLKKEAGKEIQLKKSVGQEIPVAPALEIIAPKLAKIIAPEVETETQKKVKSQAGLYTYKTLGTDLVIKSRVLIDFFLSLHPDLNKRLQERSKETYLNTPKFIDSKNIIKLRRHAHSEVFKSDGKIHTNNVSFYFTTLESQDKKQIVKRLHYTFPNIADALELNSRFVSTETELQKMFNTVEKKSTSNMSIKTEKNPTEKKKSEKKTSKKSSKK